MTEDHRKIDGGPTTLSPSFNDLISFNNTGRTEVTEDVEGRVQTLARRFTWIPVLPRYRPKKAENDGYIASTVFSFYEYHEY